MERKKVIELKEFIETLKKHKCKFRKIAGIYPANCNGIKYVGQKIDFKKVEVFQLEDKEAELIKKVMLLFPDGEIKIKKTNKV